jgi:hypothetical protein
MVRTHPQPCFLKQDKHTSPSVLFIQQSSCPHNPPNEGRSSTHLLSSSHSKQLNICDECGQHSYTPQTSQKTIQSAPSRMSHLKELPCLRNVQTNTLPTLTNEPHWISKSSYNHLQVTKVFSTSSNVPYQRQSNTTQVTWSVFFPFGLTTNNSWLTSLLTPFVSWNEPVLSPTVSIPNFGIVVMTIKSSHDPMKLDKAPNTKAPHPSYQTRHMYRIHYPLHCNDLSNAPHQRV